VFSRIAVVDQGQPAVRLIRAVRELDAEHTAPGPGVSAGHIGDLPAAVASAEGAEQTHLRAELRPRLVAAVARGMERATSA
jgi:hypothetical protein